MKTSLIIGTRGSDLALWQANYVQSKLKTLGVESTIHIIKTQGDQIQHLSLDKLEGKGFFTKEIEDALLKNEVDIAVHSHKDLETEQPFGLMIASVSDRADASEMLLIHPRAIDENQKIPFKLNAVIGTSSARRKSQILHFRPDITLQDIRGNVPTRVQKLRDGQYDAILLAKAGLDRLELDLSDLKAVPLDPEYFVPAPAQGVLAIQCRSNDEDTIAILKKMNNDKVAITTGIERTVLNKMHGGCHLPLGVYATEEDGEYTVHVSYATAWDQPVRNISFMANNAEGLPQLIVDEIKK
jgi:hydroxymethylbilane synthase